MSYYTAIIILTWIALGVLAIITRENDRMPKRDKRVFYLTYALIALSALSEWLAIQFAGTQAPHWIVRLAKCADYILTPAAGGSIVLHFKGRRRWRRMILYMLAANTALQLLSLFTGWMVVIDERNGYARGPLYGLYIAGYLMISALIAAEFFTYGRQFRRQNRLSLNAILLLVGAGILLQELTGSEVRTAYLAFAMGMAMLFIHYCEFSQLETDDTIHEQERLLTTDALTGVFNRYAFERDIAELDAEGELPDELTVFSIDVNGLKTVNDTLGHEAGDELIRGAADCLQRTLGEIGKCYRTGGDEFVVLAAMDKNLIAETLSRVAMEASCWHGKQAKNLFMAVGCARASAYRGCTAERLVSVADRAMYREKDAYYRETGAKRRGAPPSAGRQKPARITPAALQ